MTQREKTNILLVDDQPARLISYQAILSDLGENLVSASSGLEALELLMKDEYAVILLDVSMPGMDGFETAALIHEHPRFEKTPIIFVTGLHVTDLDRLKGYELGAVDYVYVPVVPQILRSKVAVLVELHIKRRELQVANRELAEANAELALSNSTLQAEKTRELQQLNSVLEAANVELEEANATLQSEMAARERLESTLREADRKKDEFLALLAHELRNPLAPIQNAVQILRQSQIPDNDVVWCRDVIERQTEHLARLVGDLLDVSRITQGKITLHKERVAMSTVVARAIETNRPLIDARRHNLTVDMPQEPVWVHGDLTRLAQIVGNLVSNAAKYTDDGGQIRLSVQEDASEAGQEQVIIRVKDSGIGIPQPMLPRVFEMFTQIENTVDRAQGGLGIGLALVRRLVDLHGGTICALSDGPGTGSEFIVCLPAAESTVDHVVAPTPCDERPARPLSRRVLVADDNVDSAQSLAKLLEVIGNEVRVARDGVEALELADRFRPDVMLLDIGMPRLDGYGVATQVRAKPWGRDVLLIALTGWGQPEVRERTRIAGFDAHLVKPVELDVLAKLLASPPRSRMLVS